MSNMNVNSNYAPAAARSAPSVEREPRDGLKADTERASGAIAGYMHQNGVESLDPNQLYAMSNNQNGHTPPEVQKAAKFMLANPQVYEKIETHDWPGSDGKSSVRNFDQAAQGNVSVGSPASASDRQTTAGTAGSEMAPSVVDQTSNAAGALGAFMHSHGMNKLDVNKLYELSTKNDGSVPERVQESAKFMLQHPNIYKKIETSDVAGADGISGVGNFDRAAQQGGSKTGSASEENGSAHLRQFLNHLRTGPSRENSNADNGLDSATNRGSLKDRTADAAGALGAYMHSHGMGKLDVNKLYELSNNKDGSVPERVRESANFMLQHPNIYKKIETSDVAGADGISGVGNFDRAAQEGGSKTGRTVEDNGFADLRQSVDSFRNGPNRESTNADNGVDSASKRGTLKDQTADAAGALGAYMHSHGMGKLDVNKLYELSNNKDGSVPERVRESANFMLQHPNIYKKIETSDVAGADGISGVGNFDLAAQR